MTHSFFNKDVEEIRAKIKSSYERYTRNLEKINEEWRTIKSKCTHPEIGESIGIYICPDCEYYGGPEYPETLSDRDYINYDINIEKTRQWRRQLKTKHTRVEIIEMKNAVKEKIDSLKSFYAIEEKKLYDEWEIIKKKCNHLNVSSDKFCMDCGSYFGEPFLF